MQDGPIPNEPKRRSGANLTDHQLAIEVELGLLALMVRVEMRWLMLPVEHPDGDPEKD
jgi:hypothetical protein